MEFLRGLELAMKHGLTKEEFKSIWEFELTIKQIGSNRAQESRNTPPPSYHDDMKAAIEAHLPPQSSQLSQERDDLMFDVQKHLQSLLGQFQEQQQIVSDNVHSQLEKMKTDFECHFDLLSQLVANSAENLTSSLKIFIIQEMDVMKQDLQIKFENYSSSLLTNHTAKISSMVTNRQDFKSKLEPKDNVRSNSQRLNEANYPSLNSLAQPQEIVQSNSQMEKEVHYHNLKSPMQSEKPAQSNSGSEGKSLKSSKLSQDIVHSNSGSEGKSLMSPKQSQDIVQSNSGRQCKSLTSSKQSQDIVQSNSGSEGKSLMSPKQAQDIREAEKEGSSVKTTMHVVNSEYVKMKCTQANEVPKKQWTDNVSQRTHLSDFSVPETGQDNLHNTGSTPDISITNSKNSDISGVNSSTSSFAEGDSCTLEEKIDYSSIKCLPSTGAVSFISNCSQFRASGQRYVSTFFQNPSKTFRVRLGISFNVSDELVVELLVSRGELPYSLSGSVSFKSTGYISQPGHDESLQLSPIWSLNTGVHKCLHDQKEIVFKPSVKLSTVRGGVVTNVTYQTLNKKSFTHQNCLQFKWHFSAQIKS